MITGLLNHIWLRPITLHCSSNVFSFLSQIIHQSLSKISKCPARCKEIYRQDAGIVTLYKCQSRNVTGLIELCTDRRAVLCLGWARLGATGLPCSDAYRSRLSLCRNKAVFTQISAVSHILLTPPIIRTKNNKGMNYKLFLTTFSRISIKYLIVE